MSGFRPTLITKHNLEKYILPHEPLHPAYKYLSAVHRADYLRTYFKHFYGGGDSDIKQTRGSWKTAFNKLQNTSVWIVGYKERGAFDVAGGQRIQKHWRRVVGNCAYICRPRTPFTTEWYNSMLALMDTKLGALRKHPASDPRDASGMTKYPIEWNEMLGSIFHPLCVKFSNHISQALPPSVFENYQ